MNECCMLGLNSLYELDWCHKLFPYSFFEGFFERFVLVFRLWLYEYL